jgi:Fe2+ or Zn2+ uptake regulation protein
MRQAENISIETLRGRFAEAGLRFTRQREAVWNLFARSGRGFSVVEAAKALRKKRIGPATVYRTVALLEEMGLLCRIHDERREHRFVACTPGHVHHLVCTNCGRVVEFEACGIPVLERLLAVETGFSVEGHYLEVYGICSKCREAAK